MSTVLTESVPLLSRAEIEQHSMAVLQEHGLESIPVNPLVLANRLGIAVNNAEFFDNSTVGMIAKRGDQVAVLLKTNAPPFRKRFAIAHELGHYFLHLAEDGEFVDSDANLFRGSAEDQREAAPDWRKEIQANLFGMALLMPEADVRMEWHRLKSIDAMKAIDAMAHHFEVLRSAMGIRIGQLGLI